MAIEGRRVRERVDAILTARVSPRVNGGKRLVHQGKRMCKPQGGVIAKDILSTLEANSNPPTSSRVCDRRSARAPVRFRI